MLKCSTHSIKSTLLKNTIQEFLEHLQSCASITTFKFQTFSRENRSSHAPPPTSLPSSPLSLIPCNQSSTVCLSGFAYTGHFKKSNNNVDCCVWFLSLSIIFSRFVHVASMSQYFKHESVFHFYGK